MALDWLEDFKPPETPLEALERSLEFAQNERRWATTTLFRMRGGIGGKSARHTMSDRQLCENVSACAMGILVIACLDGPAVRRYFDASSSLGEMGMIRDSPIAKSAAKILARSFDPSIPAKGKGSGITVAVNEIVTRNDRLSTRHRDIVGAFEGAVAIARREQEETKG